MSAPSASQGRVLPDVLEEHLEEFDLLWARRQSEIVSPDGRADSLATLEERMSANLEGLRVGGTHSLEIAAATLPGAKGSTAFAAAYVLLALGRASEEALVLSALEAADADAADGLRHALRHRAHDRFLDQLPRLLTGPESPASVAVADALAFRRKSPAVDLERYLGFAEPWVRRVAWSAAARLETPLAATGMRAGFEDADPTVAHSAIEAGCWLGRREVLEWCRARSARAGPGDRQAVAMLGVLGDADDLAALVSASNRAPTRDAALLGLGYLGDPAGIERVLDAMTDPALAVAAGEAFRQITGADIDAREEPKEPQTAEHPIGDPAEFLSERPSPDPSRASAFWSRRRGEFRSGRRYRFGVLLDARADAAPDLQGRWHTALRAPLEHGQAISAADDPERFSLR